MASLDEAKRNIRALLESATHGILLNKVSSEYNSVVGETLNFRKLGYGSVRELFADIPDTAVITSSHLGPLITCVANEKTMHIERMVRTQKTVKSTKHIHVPKKAPVVLLPNPQQNRFNGPPAPDRRPAYQQYAYQNPPVYNYGYNAQHALLELPLQPPNRSYFHHAHQRPPNFHHVRFNQHGPPAYMRPPINAPQYYAPRPRSTYCDPRTTPGIHAEVQNFIADLLRKHPAGMPLLTFKAMLYRQYPAEAKLCDAATLSSLTWILSLKNKGNEVLVYPAKSLIETRATSSSVLRPEPEREREPSNGFDRNAVTNGDEKQREDVVAEPPEPDSRKPLPSRDQRGDVDVGTTKLAPLAGSEPRVPPNDAESFERVPCVSTQAETQQSTYPQCVRTSTSPAESYRTTSVQTALSHPNELVTQHRKTDQPDYAKSESPRYGSSRQAVSEELPKAHESSSNRFGESIKSVFIKILEDNPNGIWAAELITQYKQLTGNRLDFRELGFYSIYELVVSYADIFSYKKCTNNSDWLLKRSETSTFDSGMDSSSQDSGDAPNDKRPIKSSLSISAALKIKMLQVVCSCPNGTVLSDFEVLYKRIHNEDFVLNYSDNYYTLEAVFLALSDLFVVKYVNETKITIESTEKGRRLLGHPIMIAKPVASPPVSYPDDVVIDELTFRTQSLPPFRGQKQYFRIRVTYALHPGQFWIQLHDTQEMLEALMYQMKMLYHDAALSKAYAMPNELIAQNRVCAALYPDDQNWYRAIITSLPAEDTVQVYYVDFGNHEDVERRDIRFLKKDFMHLPTQAIMAKLRRIVPLNQKAWSAEAKKRFFHMCLDRDLYALVSGMESGLLSLCLADTSGVEEVNLNTALVEEGHAAFECLVQPSEHSSPSAPFDDPRNRNCENRSHLMTAATNSRAQPLAMDRPPESMCHSQSLIESARNIQLDEDSVRIIPTWLSDIKFNLVRINGSMYVPTFEISALFWKADMLKEIVKCSKLLDVPVTFLSIAKESRPIVFHQLLPLCPKENETKSEILLCPLARIPDILNAVGGSNKELHHAFVEVVKFHKKASEYE